MRPFAIVRSSSLVRRSTVAHATSGGMHRTVDDMAAYSRQPHPPLERTGSLHADVSPVEHQGTDRYEAETQAQEDQEVGGLKSVDQWTSARVVAEGGQVAEPGDEVDLRRQRVSEVGQDAHDGDRGRRDRA